MSGIKRQKKANIEKVEQEIAQAYSDRDANSDNVDMVKHYMAKVAFLQVELDDVYISSTAKARDWAKARKYYCSGHSTKYYF